MCDDFNKVFDKTIEQKAITSGEKTKKCIYHRSNSMMSDSEIITILRMFHNSGWFYDFELHIIYYEKGEIVNFMFTPGDVDDGESLKVERFTKELYGKLISYRGYISKNLFCRLFINGIQLISKLKNKIKNSLMSVSDKVLMRKRSIIESINDELKNMTQIEHSRHRSFHNFVNNFIAGLEAYSFFPKKPMHNLEHSIDKQLTLW